MQVSNPSSVKSTTSLDQKSYTKSSDPEIGWMTEAKDWAGELILGQTTTGRILVSNVFILLLKSLSHFMFWEVLLNLQLNIDYQ